VRSDDEVDRGHLEGGDEANEAEGKEEASEAEKVEETDEAVVGGRRGRRGTLQKYKRCRAGSKVSYLTSRYYLFVALYGLLRLHKRP
jgi:hypothetical protein